MRGLMLIFLAFLGACDSRAAQSPSTSVTVTLPPPEAAPAPGFSSRVSD